MPRMGWLEFIVLSQTLLPAMLFIPGLTSVRLAIRVLGTVLPLVAWVAVIFSGKRVPGGRPYPPAIWMAFCAIWMTLSIAHPNTNSLRSGTAEMVLNVAIFCPVFWAPRLVRDTRQIRRLIVVMLICNGAGSLVGLGQVFRPATFRPPSIPILQSDPTKEGSLTIKTEDGMEFLRPAGLTDAPGAGGIAGLLACLTGLAVALPATSKKVRLASLGTALAGLAVIFYSQARFTVIVLVAGMMAWVVMLAMQRDMRKLALLGVCGAALAFGSVGMVMRAGGMAVMNRFLTLFQKRSDAVYYENRGKFVEHALLTLLPEYPLGAGMGRFGTMHGYFGDPMAPLERSGLWVETQVEGWVLDGGAPLLLAEFGAVITAMVLAFCTAVRCPDRELRYWASVVVVFGLFAALSVLGNLVFLTSNGLQFWVLLGALYGADALARGQARARAAGVAS